MISRTADLAADGSRRGGHLARRRGDQGGVPQGLQPRREQQGRPHLPVAVGSCPGDRGVRSADERGDARRTPSTTTTSCSPATSGAALETLGTEHLKVLFRPAVRYVARFPTQRAGAGGRCADRGARSAHPHPPPAQRRRRDREDRRDRRGDPRLQGLHRDPGCWPRRWPTACRWKAPARRCRSARPACSCAR